MLRAGCSISGSTIQITSELSKVPDPSIYQNEAIGDNDVWSPRSEECQNVQVTVLVSKGGNMILCVGSTGSERCLRCECKGVSNISAGQANGLPEATFPMALLEDPR